jgi:hypothetical protein
MRLLERQDRLDDAVEAHDLGNLIRVRDIDTDPQSFTVRPLDNPQARHSVSVVGRVHRLLGLLERLQSIYHLQNVYADELAAVREVENVVERLWQRLGQRN